MGPDVSRGGFLEKSPVKHLVAGGRGRDENRESRKKREVFTNP